MKSNAVKFASIFILILLLFFLITATGCSKKEAPSYEVSEAEIKEEELETSNLGSTVSADGIEIYIPPESEKKPPNISLKKNYWKPSR